MLSFPREAATFVDGLKWCLLSPNRFREVLDKSLKTMLDPHGFEGAAGVLLGKQVAEVKIPAYQSRPGSASFQLASRTKGSTNSFGSIKASQYKPGSERLRTQTLFASFELRPTQSGPCEAVPPKLVFRCNERRHRSRKRRVATNRLSTRL